MLSHWNEKANFKTSHLAHVCSACRAAIGARCRDINGVVLKNKSHLARAKHHSSISADIATPPPAPAKNPRYVLRKLQKVEIGRYPHVMDWDRFGKKGQRCEILGGRGALVQIAFQDGTTEIISRRAIRRARASELKLICEKDGDGSTLSPSHQSQQGD